MAKFPSFVQTRLCLNAGEMLQKLLSAYSYKTPLSTHASTYSKNLKIITYSTLKFLFQGGRYIIQNIFSFQRSDTFKLVPFNTEV